MSLMGKIIIYRAGEEGDGKVVEWVFDALQPSLSPAINGGPVLTSGLKWWGCTVVPQVSHKDEVTMTSSSTYAEKAERVPGMKVRDLIKALQLQDQEAEVSMEGCDCYQHPSGDIEAHSGEDNKPWILLRNEESIAREREHLERLAEKKAKPICPTCGLSGDPVTFEDGPPGFQCTQMHEWRLEPSDDDAAQEKLAEEGYAESLENPPPVNKDLPF